MKKYWLIFKLTLMEYFVYRLNFVLWRLRSLIFLLSLIFFWQAAYGHRQELFGYHQIQMLNYLVGIALLRSLIISSRSTDLEADICTGRLNSFLLRPLAIFKFYFTRDLADKFLNIGFAIIEIAFIARFFHLSFWRPESIETVVCFLILTILAIVLFFLINITAASLAFWTGAVWAPRWLIMVILLEFMSGVYFPIDILPFWLTKMISLTPFPYLIYYPLQVWLGNTLMRENLKIFLVLSFWLVFFFFISKKIWQQGLKAYSAYGG